MMRREGWGGYALALWCNTCVQGTLPKVKQIHFIFIFGLRLHVHREVQLVSCMIVLLVLILLRRRLFLFFYTPFDVFLLSNVALGNHGRNIAPCGIICRGAMGATVFWVCRKWNNKESWGWFVLLLYLIFEANEEHPHDLERLL